MKSFLIVFFISCACNFLFAGEANVDQLVKDSDYKVLIHYPKEPRSIDIGISRKPENSPFEEIVYFELEDLVRFFGRQKHKNCISVQIFHLGLHGEELKAYNQNLVSFFKDRGYRRVIILRNSMVGLAVMEDVINK